MRVGVTGHTSGLGKGIFDHLTTNGYTVNGFSRSNGFDIEDPQTREKIISSCDVIVNNTYSTYQTTLLREVISAWDGQDKMIINIGSKATMLPVVVPGDEEYVEQKKQQQEIVRSRFFHPYPQTVNLIIGLTDSRMGDKFEGKKLDPKNLALLVEYIIVNKNELAIQEIVIDVPGQSWKEIKYAKN